MNVGAFDSLEILSIAGVARVACAVGRVVQILLTIRNGPKLAAIIVAVRRVATECREVVRG